MHLGLQVWLVAHGLERSCSCLGDLQENASIVLSWRQCNAAFWLALTAATTHHPPLQR